MTGQGYIDPDYVDVAERIRLFYEAHPQGWIETTDHGIHEVGLEGATRTFVYCVAVAYRDEKALPCTGIAWEPVPGPTPFTRDSELMNAQTSAWGRAIIAAGIPSKKVASADEVRSSKEKEAGASVEMVSKEQHGYIAVMCGEIAKATGQTVEKVQNDSRAWINEQFGKVTRGDLTHDEASKLIEHLKALKEAADIPFS